MTAVRGRRRTIAQTRVETIVAERAGILAFAREQCRQIDALAARKRLTDDEATLLKRTLRGFADGVATGLHRDGRDPDGVRALMRANVTGGSK